MIRDPPSGLPAKAVRNYSEVRTLGKRKQSTPASEVFPRMAERYPLMSSIPNFSSRSSFMRPQRILSWEREGKGRLGGKRVPRAEEGGIFFGIEGRWVWTRGGGFPNLAANEG